MQVLWDFCATCEHPACNQHAYYVQLRSWLVFPTNLFECNHLTAYPMLLLLVEIENCVQLEHFMAKLVVLYKFLIPPVCNLEKKKMCKRKSDCLQLVQLFIVLLCILYTSCVQPTCLLCATGSLPVCNQLPTNLCDCKHLTACHGVLLLLGDYYYFVQRLQLIETNKCVQLAALYFRLDGVVQLSCPPCVQLKRRKR